MLTINKAQLHEFIGPEFDSYDEYTASYDKPMLTNEQWQYLKGCVLKNIVADFNMSENHLGGDDMVGVADEVLAALKEGFTICTWYGPECEALVVGYYPTDLTITEPPEPVGDDAMGVDQDGEPVTHHSTGHPACPAVHGGTCPIDGHNHDEKDQE